MPIEINFQNAKEQSFDPLPRGLYDAVVFDAEMRQVKNEGGKLPVGTPMLAVQFKIQATDGQEEHENRRVFRQFVIAPAELDGVPYANKQMMDDILFTFYRAIGYNESELKKWKKLPDPDELAGRECVVDVRLREYPKGSGEYQNEVANVKPAGSSTGAGELASKGGLGGL